MDTAKREMETGSASLHAMAIPPSAAKQAAVELRQTVLDLRASFQQRLNLNLYVVAAKQQQQGQMQQSLMSSFVSEIERTVAYSEGLIMKAKDNAKLLDNALAAAAVENEPRTGTIGLAFPRLSTEQMELSKQAACAAYSELCINRQPTERCSPAIAFLHASGRFADLFVPAGLLNQGRVQWLSVLDLIKSCFKSQKIQAKIVGTSGQTADVDIAHLQKNSFIISLKVFVHSCADRYDEANPVPGTTMPEDHDAFLHIESIECKTSEGCSGEQSELLASLKTKLDSDLHMLRSLHPQPMVQFLKTVSELEAWDAKATIVRSHVDGTVVLAAMETAGH